MPITITSARSEELDRVYGLETGADDYVVKPYSTSDSTARIKAELQRTRTAAIGEHLAFGDVRLYAETHKLCLADNEVRLSLMEFRLLSTFMEKQTRALTREQFLDRVWDHDIYLEI